jgi:hypothetical protein
MTLPTAATAQSGVAPLQSACISQAPEPAGGTLAIPDGFDAALVASVVRRLRGVGSAAQ